MDFKTTIRNHWRTVALFIALWTGIALVSAFSVYQHQLGYDKPVSWELALRRSFKEFYGYAFLAIGILWLCQRVRLESGSVWRWIAAHSAGSILYIPTYVALVSFLEAGEVSVQTGQILTFSYLFEKLIIVNIVPGLFMYWVVVMGHLGWHSYRASRERERQASVLATELVQARLQALRNQINPHFLFNTLNTISALIHDDPQAADRMVVRLSELLRRTLDRSATQEVPLREEIEFLRSYLEIEQTRFGDRLTVDINVERDAEDLMVPFLLLQPLVENAIRHGIEPREEPGRVEVHARRAGNRLELRVKDNGDGLPAGPAREGIGLSNTRSRLMHQYDEEATFELVNSPTGGLEVRISLPARTTTEPFQPKVVVMSRRDLPAGVLPR